MSEMESARAALAGKERVMVFTGNVLAEECGDLKLFYTQEAVWGGRTVEKLTRAQTYLAHPDEVWAFHVEWRRLVRITAPSAAHHALAAWSYRHPGIHHFTFCVDDLLQRAGVKDALPLRGSLFLCCCSVCGSVRPDPSDEPRTAEQMCCPRCGKRERPAVVCRDEQVAFNAAKPAISLQYAAEAVLVIGTQEEFAREVASIVRDLGRPVIEVNPEGRGIEQASISIVGSPAELLPQLLNFDSSFRK